MSYKGFLAVFLREMKRLFTVKDLFLYCFAAPLFYGLLLSFVYYHQRVQEIPVGVIDNDRTSISRRVIRYADATENIAVTRRYGDADAAVDDMIAGRITGLLYIPGDFSSKIKQGETAYDLIAINSTNFLVANPVMQSLLEVSNTLSAQVMGVQLCKKGVMKEKARNLALPIALDARALFNPQLNYSNFILPGLLFMVIQQIILIGVGFTIPDERENRRGRMLFELSDRSYLALLLGKTLPYVLANFAMGLLFLTAVLPSFGIPVKSPLPATLLFMGTYITAVTVFGVMLSSFFRTTGMALIVLMFYSMPAYLLSGALWPAYALPLPLRCISWLFPSTYFLVDFRLLLLSGMPFHYVLDSIVSLIIFTLVCAFIAWLLFRRIFVKRGIHGEIEEA
jgi:ABC-2 type transport system permease protein